DLDLIVKSKENEELSRNDLEDLTIKVTKGDGTQEEILLSEIADFVDGKSPSSINRDAQERYISVSAEIGNDYNIGLVGRQVESLLNEYGVPDGYSLKLVGENETINEAMDQVMLMLLLAVIFMYLIMVAQFQSLLSPFIVMFTLPLAFTGGFL